MAYNRSAVDAILMDAIGEIKNSDSVRAVENLVQELEAMEEEHNRKATEVKMRERKGKYVPNMSNTSKQTRAVLAIPRPPTAERT